MSVFQVELVVSDVRLLRQYIRYTNRCIMDYDAGLRYLRFRWFGGAAGNSDEKKQKSNEQLYHRRRPVVLMFLSMQIVCHVFILL